MMDRVLRITEVEKVVGLKRPTIFKLENLGLFPRRRHIGLGRNVGWLASELTDFLKNLPLGIEPKAPQPEALVDRRSGDDTAAA
jgi:prophage regulatory protein